MDDIGKMLDDKCPVTFIERIHAQVETPGRSFDEEKYYKELLEELGKSDESDDYKKAFLEGYRAAIYQF